VAVFIGAEIGLTALFAAFYMLAQGGIVTG